MSERGKTTGTPNTAGCVIYVGRAQLTPLITWSRWPGVGPIIHPTSHLRTPHAIQRRGTRNPTRGPTPTPPCSCRDTARALNKNPAQPKSAMGDLGCVTTSAAVIGGMVVASILTGAGLPFPISIVAWIAITWVILRYIKKNRQRKQQEGTVSFDLGPTAGGPNRPTEQQTKP